MFLFVGYLALACRHTSIAHANSNLGCSGTSQVRSRVQRSHGLILIFPHICFIEIDWYESIDARFDVITTCQGFSTVRMIPPGLGPWNVKHRLLRALRALRQELHQALRHQAPSGRSCCSKCWKLQMKSSLPTWQMQSWNRWLWLTLALSKFGWIFECWDLATCFV